MWEWLQSLGAAPLLAAFSSICLTVASFILMLCVIRLGRQVDRLVYATALIETLNPDGRRTENKRQRNIDSQRLGIRNNEEEARLALGISSANDTENDPD